MDQTQKRYADSERSPRNIDAKHNRLKERELGQPVIEEVRRWFLLCLARHDREDWLLDPVRQEVETYLGNLR